MNYVIGAKNFFIKLYNEKVPILILSAGVGNVIIEILKYNNIFFDNIYIDSNFLEFLDGQIVGISSNITHTMNKNSDNLLKRYGNKIKDRENILLFGDVLSDIKMIKEEDLSRTLTVGFLDVKINENLRYYNDTFDIVCTEDTSFNEIMKFLKL